MSPWADMRFAEVEREFVAAAEEAGRRLAELGLSPEEVGEFLEGALAESHALDRALELEEPVVTEPD
jgi:hypothetical protein